MRLIDADDLQDELAVYFERTPLPEAWKEDEIQELVEEAPTVDVAKEIARELQSFVPRLRTGAWLGAPPTCSVCGIEAIIEKNDTDGAWIMTPFCPFCGARMEERVR